MADVGEIEQIRNSPNRIPLRFIVIVFAIIPRGDLDNGIF